jgi:hypothetical protein
VPVDVVRETVDVLEELPPEAGLPDPRHTGHGHQVGPPLIRAGVEQLLDQAELPRASDERRFQSRRPELPAAERDDAQGMMEVERLRLAFDLVGSGRLVLDRGIGGVPGRFGHEDTPRRGGRLHA